MTRWEIFQYDLRLYIEAIEVLCKDAAKTLWILFVVVAVWPWVAIAHLIFGEE